MQSSSREMPGWMKHKLESRLPREIPITTDMQIIPFLHQKDRIKEPLDEVKESEKNWLKLNIQKMKIIASNPTTSWQIDEETTKTVTDFIFLGSKITADGDYSHEIKTHLFLGRKAMTNLDGILESRAITWPTKSI